jgi:hypothetical protein
MPERDGRLPYVVRRFLTENHEKPRETVQSFDNGFQDIFAECLSINDRFRKVLADAEIAALTETDASTMAASAPVSVQEQFK